MDQPLDVQGLALLMVFVFIAVFSATVIIGGGFMLLMMHWAQRRRERRG